MVTAVTTRPLRVNSQNEIGDPARRAMPSTTTLALAPIAVALPPRSVPRARAHQIESACDGFAVPAVRDSTSGLMVATYGMLLTTADTTAEPTRISSIANSALPAVASASAC